MIEEAKSWKNAYFFTLTYRESSLAYNVVSDFPDGLEVTGRCRGRFKDGLNLDSFESIRSTSCKKDIQGWFKRFRTNYVRRRARALGISDIDKQVYKSLSPKFSYFVTSEYAPDGVYVDRKGCQRRSTMRPHYHGIIFTDIPYGEIAPLFGDWISRYGFVQWSRIRSKKHAANAVSSCANYCAKYCCKGCFASRLDDIEAGVIEKPWRLVSKGLGSAFIDKNKHLLIPPRRGYKSYEYIEHLVDICFYADGAYQYKLPRYYKERIYYKKRKVIQSRYSKASGKVEAYETFRYTSQAPLPLKMQAVVRSRIEDAYNKRFAVCKADNPSWSDSQVHIYLALCDTRGLESRRKNAVNKLNRFYRENEIKNWSLMI